MNTKGGIMITISEEEKEKMKSSYMTKEEFVDLISNIDFKYVKDSHINLVTDFIIAYDRDQNEYLKSLGKEIRID